VAILIPVANPTDKPLVLRAQYSSPSLVGPSRATVPPGSGSGGGGGGGAFAFECYYAPLVEGEEEGVVRLVGDEAGALRGGAAGSAAFCDVLAGQCGSRGQRPVGRHRHRWRGHATGVHRLTPSLALVVPPISWHSQIRFLSDPPPTQNKSTQWFP
jgi:hypothetical protein